MSYKNDHLLTISNKFGDARGDAVAELYETYDKLRDLAIAGTTNGGGGSGIATGFLMNVARVFAPASFMPVLGNNSINIPGTSYSTPYTGGTAIMQGGTSAFGTGNLGKYPGLPTGNAASIVGLDGLPFNFGIGNDNTSLYGDYTIGGMPTGFAASMVGTVGNAASFGAGAASGYGYGNNVTLPLAGIISGIGGLVTAISPYLGPGIGLGGALAGNLLQGYGGAALGAYSQVSGRILNNADTILANKVKNIETVVKMIDAQNDVIKKMLKSGIEADSKAVQDM